MATISSTIELIDKVSATLSTIEGNVNSMKNALKGVESAQDALNGASFSKFLSSAEQAGKKMKKIGQEMTLAISAPLVLLGKEMYGNAVDYEAAFVGMQKTVDGTTEQYEQLKQTALELSETTPMNYVDLMGIAQTGGNLGVAIDDMETFMQSYARLQYATDQHISGESGAQDVASFLNITEGGVANIERFGSSIVHLGNNFNATEDQIIAMGNRMASAAHLAGASTPEILGMATAFTSVGINAEAGGSAASKLFKQMQLAVEVGGSAQEKLAAIGQSYDSALEFSLALDGMKKADLVDMASSLGMTTEAVQSMADSWVLMEQFAQVSGKTSDQFIDDWGTNAVNAMADFFTGLNASGEDGAESILATLDKMGLTEIRESNLIAAMASRPELFVSAVQAATEAYQENNAMVEEFNKQMETTQSQNDMLKNKFENTTANFGENLVQMLQPALDKVNELMTAFNSLSETDQDAILTAFMVFAAGGPIVTAVGATVEAIGKIGTGISKAKTAISGWLGKGGLSAVLSSPATWGIAAGGALLLFIEYLDSIPSKFETLVTGAKDIPITIDEASYQDTLSKISEVQAALDGLKPGEIKPEYENISAGVSYGFGTQEMYATALAYEAAKANANISDVVSGYAEKMNEAQARIAEAAGRGDTAAASAAKAEYESLRTALNAELVSMKGDYSSRISELFNGMASQYPEAAQALTKAAADYDLASTMNQVMNFDWDAFGDDMIADAAHSNLMKNFLTQAFNAGYMDDGGFADLNSMLSQYENGWLNGSLWLDTISDKLAESMQTNMETVSNNPILSTMLASLLSDPTLTENLDMTQLNGALEGLVKTLDFKQACEKAGENPNDWGKYLSEGLGSGISENASVATDAGTSLGTDTINNIKSALGVASPSVFMIEAGLFADQGLMMGIQQGQSMVVAAALALGNQVVSVVRSTLAPGVGSGIGSNFAAGLASGIRSGIGSVTAAASALASAALSAAQGTLGIHSPSTETYWQGEMMIQGYINAIEDGSKLVKKTVNNAVKGTSLEWNSGVWDLISGFASIESQALQDQMNNVEDGIRINDSDIKKIRTLAEREVINHVTNPSFNIEMPTTVYAKEEADVDGIISRLEDKVSERLEAVAEGVYN